MKKSYLLLFALFIYSNAIACTIIPVTFCQRFESSPEDLVVLGEIISIDNLGLDFEIMEVLRGEETRNIIRIWNGTDFDCNGPFSLAASTIGEVNDQFVIILPKITEKINEWDVVDDYRRPDPYRATTELKLEGVFLKGLIAGYHIVPPPQGNLLVMHYDSFKERIIDNGDCSSIVVETRELEEKSKVTVNNPVISNLNIRFDGPVNDGWINLYSISGQLLIREEINSQNTIGVDASGLQSGLYVLEIQEEGKLTAVIKIVKL